MPLDLRAYLSNVLKSEIATYYLDSPNMKSWKEIKIKKKKNQKKIILLSFLTLVSKLLLDTSVENDTKMLIFNVSRFQWVIVLS